MTRSLLTFVCALAVISAPATAAPKREAAPSAQPNWVAAWGYVISPLPPGQQPAAPNGFGPPAVPLGAAAGPARQPNPPRLIDNPGHVPIDTGTNDLVDATVRQIVRVSAAGSAVRLRLSNESGVDALPIGAVHVGLAGPDGSVLPAPIMSSPSPA